MITQTIRVTAEHIKRGVPELCGSCPIALAIWDAWPRTGTVSVLADVSVLAEIAMVTTIGDTAILCAGLPAAAQHFVAAFDQPDQWIGPSPVKPFEFEVTWLTPDEAAAVTS